ncbi:DUF3944 domain-containing protein [Fusobacterium nucleatum]|jgi:hypothetical protein|uniref:DUF3944 domain-containing protein n=1 Tax=Fusobacterium nucleatum TaxID=851 RepID=UPI003569250E
MAYTYDENLEFLGECTDEQLKDLAEILIYDTDRKYRNMEEITSTNEHKRYKEQYSKYWEILAGDLQKFGGDSIANAVRFGKGVKYDEILNDTLKYLKISFDKSSSIVDREDKLVEKIFEIMIKEMKENDLTELSKILGIGDYKIPAIMFGVQGLIKAGGFGSYKITVIVANYITKFLFGRGLSFTTNAMLTKGLSLLIGSVGIGVTTGFWFAIGITDITGPAMRVTIPACVIVACLRKTIMLEKENK